MLLIISNNNMSLRELYTAVLDTHPAGWITSFMSGLPGGAESIVSGYDAVIYELGGADKPERVAAARGLQSAGVPVITHVEGRAAAQRAQELAQAGVLVVSSPISAGRIEETLDQLMARIRTDKKTNGRGVRDRFRRFLGR